MRLMDSPGPETEACLGHDEGDQKRGGKGETRDARRCE